MAAPSLRKQKATNAAGTLLARTPWRAVPLATETGGRLGKEALTHLQKLARKQADPDNWQSGFNISKVAPVFGSTADPDAPDASSEGETPSVRDLPDE